MTVRQSLSISFRHFAVRSSNSTERITFPTETLQIRGTGQRTIRLAFLNAALSVTLQADKNRIAVFGKSRGGTLAMLVGIRDKRIKQVVSWSGPVDWFELMGANGWPEKAIVADALLKRVEPQKDGGQFVRTFLTRAISGERNLAQVRLHMIESSPLYFIDRLPALEAYYGIEDRMVPVRNGRALAKALQNRDLADRVFYHADAGHDFDRTCLSRIKEIPPRAFGQLIRNYTDQLLTM